MFKSTIEPIISKHYIRSDREIYKTAPKKGNEIKSEWT